MPPSAIESKTKKELKDFVNENGFFFHIKCDAITTDEAKAILTDAKASVLAETGKEIPVGENIVVFKGIASQNYAKGEKNRNGYKYDQNGWNFDSYLANPIILWQHNAQYGGIGNAISFWKDKEDNLCALFFVDLETLDERNRVQVKRGYVTAISTGAIAKEYKFEENETGDLYTEEEAEDKFGSWNVFLAYIGQNENLTLVVTKAEMLENSLVTIGSNEQAIAMQNAMGNFFKAIGDDYKLKKESTMTKQVAGEGLVDDVNEESEEVAEETPTSEENSEEVPSEETPVSEEVPADEAKEAETPDGDANPEEVPGDAENAEVEAGTVADTVTKSEGEAREPEQGTKPTEQKEDFLRRSEADSLEKSFETKLQDAEKRIRKELDDEYSEAFKTLADSLSKISGVVTVITDALKSERRSIGLNYVETSVETPKATKYTDAISRIQRIK